MIKEFIKISMLLMLTSFSLSSPAAVKFKWLGVAGFSLQDESTTLVFDPAITRPSFWDIAFFRVIDQDDSIVSRWTKQWGVDKCDAIFVSHEHHDHSIDAPYFAKQFGGTIYGTKSLLNIGRGRGVNETQLKSHEIGQTVQVGKFKVTSFESPHGPFLLGWYFVPGEITEPIKQPATAWDYHVGESVGFFIEHPQGNIIFQQTGSIPSPDPMVGKTAVVLLQGLPKRKSTEDIIEQRVKRLNVKRIVPLHFDNFFNAIRDDQKVDPLPTVDLEEFLSTSKKQIPEVEIIVPEYGKEFVLLP